eukprot:GHRQ01017156.1.p1 GENE.GHRQ01017156.1~~GHRQ01017156.1.p1  ORF type:complete len:130 (-),score=5.29 GHRQ01017156.1:12-401(-)
MVGCKPAGLQAQVAGSNPGRGTDNKISTGGNAQPAQVLQHCLLVDFCVQLGITTTYHLPVPNGATAGTCSQRAPRDLPHRPWSSLLCSACSPDVSPRRKSPPSSLDVFVQQWIRLGLLTCTTGAAELSH